MALTIYLHLILESGFAVFCILAAIYIRLYKAMARRMTDMMTALLLTSAVVNIADALAYFYRGNTTATGFYMVRICNFIVFAGMFVMLAEGNLLLDEALVSRGGGGDKRLRDAVYAVCASAAALLILSAFAGFLYSFDGQNIYHRGAVYPVIPALGTAAIALATVRLVKERGVLPRGAVYSFMCLLFLPAAGAVIQPFYYGISISNIANSIAILITLTVFMREAVRGMSVRKSFILTGESIERISEDIDRFLEGTGTERQNRIRIRFTVEEALIRIWKHFGESNMVRVTAGIKFGRPSIRIEHEGEAFNPFSKTRNSYEDWTGGLLASAGLSPAYNYFRGSNIIRIVLGRMQINPVITVMAAIVLGLVTGSVASMVLAPADAAFVTEDILVPVYDLWNRILYSVSAPAMLVIVMSTTMDTREVSEQGGNAVHIVGRYLGVTFIMGAVTFAATLLFRPDGFASEEFTRYTFSDLLKRFFSVVPENFIDPFRDFNTAQLILMGLVFAYAIMALGQQASGVASLVQQLNLVATQLARWIARLMPLFTVFLTAQLMIEGDADLLLRLLKVIPLALTVSLTVMAMGLLYVSIKMNVGAGVLLKKLWPSFLLTLRTGQIENSYALAEKCCRNELGIQRIFTQRLLPLGLVLYMPVSAIGMISFVIYAAFRSGIAITPVWMLTAAIFALILLVAAPPIPGVDLLSYVVIIGQLGIDNRFIIAAMIFDIVFNLFASAANQMMLQMDLILQADRVGLLNHNTLRKDTDADAAA